MTWSDDELDAFVDNVDHHDPRFIEDPHPVYRALRERCPVAHSDRYGGFWLITRYEDVRAAAKDWQTFTSSVPNVTAIPSSHPREEPDLPIEIDPPLHTRYRQLVAPVFTRPFVESFEPRIRLIATGLIERIVETGGGDLVSGFAVPLSVGTLATFMGLPDEDHSRWVSWVRRMYDPSDQEGAREAGLEYFDYIDALVAERRARPTDDFISMLLDSEVKGEQLRALEVSRFMRVLLIAGHETTAAAMSFALHYLAEHAEEWRRLVDDRSLIPGAVEEFLRLSSTVTLQARNATRDLAFRGAAISEGDVVALLFPSANHDETVFVEPERCVLDRSPNRHVAFGFGPHVCLGAHVARLELRIMLDEFAERIPVFCVAPGEQARWNSTGSVRGLANLRVLVSS